MGRKKKTIDRGIAPDPRYNSVVISKFVNRMMWEGKRSVSLRIVHDALGILQQKTEKEPLEVFLKALDNVKPVIEVKSRRVGGATYQVPVEVRPGRSQALGIRWIIINARKRSEKTMILKLAGELLDAYNGRGGAVKKRDDVHKMAEANRAFAHYRW